MSKEFENFKGELEGIVPQKRFYKIRKVLSGEKFKEFYDGNKWVLQECNSFNNSCESAYNKYIDWLKKE